MGFLNLQSSLSTSDSSTTSTTMVDAFSNLTLSADDTTTDFLVIYGASFGGNDASQVGEVQCVTGGGTVLGVAAAESNGTGTSYGGGRIQGFARYTKPSGADTLKLQHRNITSSDTNRTGGQFIHILPLDQARIFVDDVVIQEHVPLTENADFFYSGTNSSSSELSGIGNTWTTARTVDFTLPSAGDYFVLFSVETVIASGSATDGAQARFQIDGTTQGAEWVREWENNSDRQNFAYSDRVNLSAGSHTFRIQVQNRNASSQLAAYRTRIWAFRAESFLASAQDVETTGDSAITHTAYSDSEIFLATSITSEIPDARTLGIATVNLGSSSTGVDTLVEIRDNPTSGGSARCLDSGFGFNDAGLDSGDDLMPTVIAQNGLTSSSSAKGFRVRTRISASGTGTAGRNAGNSAGVRNNLVLWPMFLREQDPLTQDGEGVLRTER